MVIPRFIEQALSGGPITVYGDGTQTRCFADVREVVGAIMALLNSPVAWGRVFNVGSPHEVSVNEVAEKIRLLVNPRCEVERIPFQDAYGPGFEDLDRRVPAVGQLQAAIGFAPSRRLDEFLSEIVDEVQRRWQAEARAT
jgi:UDP-glucose 4-epimerase